jgi:hypothetical protein
VTALSGIASTLALALLYGLGWSIPGTLTVIALLPAALTAARRLLPSARPAWARTALTVPARTWAAVLLAALVNWTLDMLCLVAAALACGAEVSWGRLALLYLAVQVVRQVPVTPGGLGLIETSMLAGLTAAGADGVTAAAVVLVYRLLSFWLILPLGLGGHLMLRHRAGDSAGGGPRDPAGDGARDSAGGPPHDPSQGRARDSAHGRTHGPALLPRRGDAPTPVTRGCARRG